jgi:iron complex transport system substrate-binding protein
MFALGLADKMVGTAYLDDFIWPQYASAYANIPVLSSGYPTQGQIFNTNPDFIVASYQSAFRQVYTSGGKVRGIFSNATIGPCVGAGSEFGQPRPTCRPQLHANGTSTYLFKPSCEDTNLRPSTVTEQTVYEEMRTLGRIFNVDAEALIADMRSDFDAAAALVAASGTALSAVWIDCLGCSCEDYQVFVGAGSGTPAMMMNEAGLTNVFANVDANWACVNISQITAANPDVLIIAHASWDTALSKVTWLYNHSSFCDLDAIKGARLIQIPFSATTLSPRNGPAARDLATAALHVRIGATTPIQSSGVSSFDGDRVSFNAAIAGTTCNLVAEKLEYNISDLYTVTDATTDTTSSAFPQKKNMLWLLVLACFAVCS